ncbi:MAG TPA: hypothetical protein VEG39_17545 [Clostridia bacterium]|nr:hypothetical protein [Clostridia bacterium]
MDNSIRRRYDIRLYEIIQGVGFTLYIYRKAIEQQRIVFTVFEK